MHAICARDIVFGLAREVNSKKNPCRKYLPCTSKGYVLNQYETDMHETSNKTVYGYVNDNFKKYVKKWQIFEINFRLFLYPITADVLVYEEYLLFDFNAIVSSVGGSLGLFVGFSFLQCAMSIFGLTEKTCQKCKGDISSGN